MRRELCYRVGQRGTSHLIIYCSSYVAQHKMTQGIWRKDYSSATSMEWVECGGVVRFWPWLFSPPVNELLKEQIAQMHAFSQVRYDSLYVSCYSVCWLSHEHHEHSPSGCDRTSHLCEAEPLALASLFSPLLTFYHDAYYLTPFRKP